MIDFARKRMALIAISLPLVACGGTSDSWVAQCESAVAKFGSQGFSDVTYTPLPELKGGAGFLQLSWSGLHVPIPNGPYKDVIVTPENDDDIALILVAENGIRIVTGHVYGNEELKSLFQVAGEIPTDEEEAWTRSAFDKPIRTSDLTDLGYRITMKDVNCDAENEAKESAKLVSLVLKSVGPEVVAAHKLSLAQQNWVTASSYDQQSDMFSANVVDDAGSGNEIAQVSYIVPSGVDDFSLYAGISTQDVSEGSNPAWLRALNRALETHQKSDWVAYLNEAGKAGISEKSIAASKSRLGVQ